MHLKNLINKFISHIKHIQKSFSQRHLKLYDRSQRLSLENAVNRFNAKISRLERLDKKLLLPERVSYYDIIDSATSKQDLTKKIESLERFLTRDAGKVITTEAGVKTVNYVVSETERQLRSVKTKLTKQIKQLEGITPTIFGTPVDASYKQMGSEALNNLRARRKVLNVGRVKNLSKKAIMDVQRQIQTNIRKMKYKAEVFKNNYIEKMLFNLAYYTGYKDKDKLEHIRSKLNELDEKTFLKLFNTEKAIERITDYYPEITDSKKSPNDISEEVSELYDELYNNIDEIVSMYL